MLDVMLIKFISKPEFIPVAKPEANPVAKPEAIPVRKPDAKPEVKLEKPRRVAMELKPDDMLLDKPEAKFANWLFDACLRVGVAG